MLRMSLAQIAQAVGGRLHGPQDLEPCGLYSDTREPLPGGLFVALRGPRFDAHAFLGAAAAQAAAAALVEQRQAIDLPQIVVEDTRLALGRLAAAWRAAWPGRLVALTGSQGKTTTKEMLAAILRLRAPTLATQGNLNNDIGVPLMLARLAAAHAFAVIEMGASHAGEIAYLTTLARPDVALVTRTGRAHLQGFGGLEGVIRAKGEIYTGLVADGMALINADDPGAASWLEQNAQRRVLSFGMDRPAAIQGRWQPSPAGGRLVLRHAGFEVPIELSVAGAHNARNALAAASAAIALGFGLDEIAAGLATFTGVPGRLQRKRGVQGCVLWDDSYNANPDSLRAGLEAVRLEGQETWLVLGDMGELGDEAAALHAESGRLAQTLGVARLYATGELAAHAAQAFGAGARHFEAIEPLLSALRAELQPGIHVLIKGSRAARMERVVQALEVPPC